MVQGHSARPVQSAKVYAGDDSITGANGNKILKVYDGRGTIKALRGNDDIYGGTGPRRDMFDTRLTSANRDAIYDLDVRDNTIRSENAISTKIRSNGTQGGSILDEQYRQSARPGRLVYLRQE